MFIFLTPNASVFDIADFGVNFALFTGVEIYKADFATKLTASFSILLCPMPDDFTSHGKGSSLEIKVN